ncbi:MAG TPA: 7-cyano-7-deazaguanine synthase QueC [Thermodesulfovibrionales bacterium]|nr:7-cyano-7-deazaguanine synthase QueC [Thermodesulfovibrionales bacterium]
MKKELSVVLVSGGMDSCVTAAIANETYRLALLHVNYGQRTEERELRAFSEIADHYKTEKRLVVSIEHLKVIGGSALTDPNIPVLEADPLGTLNSELRTSSIPSTYVPFRNAHLLSIAVSWAEVIGATRIFIGAVEEDSSGYPDCREVFYQAFNKAIETGTRPETHIRIETPLIHLKKSDIVKKGTELKAPLQLTWSCYQASEKACGKCESCALRLKGFKEAGVKDPIVYE